MNRLLTALTILFSTFSSSAADRLNVLFIAVDDLKPTLGCYGNQIVKTPNIDALANSGIIFSNAHCQWPVCGPSRASLMTSLRPEAVGVMDLKTSMRAKNPAIITLPQQFRNQGYVTAGTGKIYDPRCVDNKKDLDAVSWSIPYRHQKYSKLAKLNDKQVTDAPDVEDTALIDGQIRLSGLELMRELANDDKPFFLAVGFKKPHLAFIAPKRYWDLYQRDALPLAQYQGEIANGSGYTLHNSAELRGYLGVPKSGPIPEALQRKLIHGYYACVSYIDAQIGLLMKELNTLGLRKNTVIVLWGDHGFHLGGHSMWGKHSTLEQATRSPLIFSAPNWAKEKNSSSPVEFVDIFPTLCEITGIKTPKAIHGRSLLPIWRGEKTRVRNGALTLHTRKGAFGYSYRTERYRYIEWINKRGVSVGTDLFDYHTDPLETKSLAADPDHQELKNELAAQMREEAEGSERLFLKEQARD